MDFSKGIKSFSQIIGQERAVSFLKRVIAGEKIPHAYLFTGISGIGKTTTALSFTQAINCYEPVEREGCGKCRVCRSMASGNFPDIIFIEPQGQYIKIEQIRELNRRLNFKPVAGSYRVSIVNQAEMMTEEAANSFLKTLEEPPPGNILILKTVEPMDLLPTIVSRCQKIPFRPLPISVIEEWLRSEMGVEEESASLIARISEGSMGRAGHVRESGFMEERQGFLSELIGLSSTPKDQAVEIAQEYTKKGGKGESGGPNNNSTFQLLSVWKTWYRDLILIKVNGPASLIINADFSQKLKSLSKKVSIANLIESFLLIDQAQRDLTRNSNPGLLMENTVLGLKRLGVSLA